MASDAMLSFEAQVPAEQAGASRLHARFDVPAGITVLLGPSGAGKSTCLYVIAGLLKPASGHIALGSEVFIDSSRGIFVPPHLRRVALVFQSLALFPHLTGEENVAYGMRSRAAEAKQWLERMKVPQLAARKPATFSGGEAQRVALARALASSPRVLLLDEPFSALDVPLRRELGHELKALVAELKIPTLLVTHDREDARALGERMIQLQAGRVVER
ncbi:MAG: ATP-binding cassette domain-containing protein [Myxococcaceae bacterium]|nr:ATP-binding cassette domain-containing protein [Myxococcaceae bacterium]